MNACSSNSVSGCSSSHCNGSMSSIFFFFFQLAVGSLLPCLHLYYHLHHNPHYYYHHHHYHHPLSPEIPSASQTSSVNKAFIGSATAHYVKSCNIFFSNSNAVCSDARSSTFFFNYCHFSLTIFHQSLQTLFLSISVPTNAIVCCEKQVEDGQKRKKKPEKNVLLFKLFSFF